MSEVSALLRSKIERLEGTMRRMDQVAIETKHHFAKGMYAREIFIPAGVLLTGKVHKTEHLNVCVGDITVWTEDGMKRLTGHNTIVSKPGAKRVGYAHGDTYWTTFHVTDETDIEKLEALLVEPLPQLEQTKQLESAT